MLYTTKEELIKMLESQANEKMQDKDRRRRLDGRLEKTTIELLSASLPDIVKYQKTTSGNIRADWFALNNNIENLHIFNNNTQYIQTLKTYKYTYIVVIKATYQGVIKCLTKNITDERLTLENIKWFISEGLMKEYTSLESALNN